MLLIRERLHLNLRLTINSSSSGLKRERLARRLLQALAVWGVLSYALVMLVILTESTNPDDRAIILMGGALMVIWIGIGGVSMRRGRERFVRWAGRLPLRWPVRFVLLCIVMALFEEVVTTGLNNLAPLFGATGKTDTYITASNNYLEVVLLHSVIIFVPMFCAWALLLKRYAFRPLEVMLLFGLTGTLSESIAFGSQNLLSVGFWVFVYGLMVYLPAYTVPPDRIARPVRWWHWPLAVVVPIVAAVPFVPFVMLAQKAFMG